MLRSVLTTLGIVLGVALLVAMRASNESVLRAFSDTVIAIAGKTQLQVSAGDTGIPEDVLEQVQSIGVVGAAAPIIEAVVDTGLPRQGKLLILGVDMTGDQTLRDYDFSAGEELVDDPLVFLAQPDSLIITAAFAGKNGIETGDRILLDTMDGRKQFTVRGILKAGGMAAAFGGNLAVMDIYAAQAVFGRGRRFDRIDIRLADGVSLEQGEQAIRNVLGDGLNLEPPSGRGQQFQILLSIYSAAVDVSSLFALFIAVFIIYNSFAIAVTQRRREIGIMRALGATRGQIRSLFLVESAVAGVLGSAIGLAIGLFLAQRVTGMTARMLEAMLGVSQNAEATFPDSRLLIFAFLVGVSTSILAAVLPALNAARVEPVQALQKGKYQMLSTGESRRRRAAAFVSAAGALTCLAFSSYRPVFYTGYLLLVLSTLFAAPFLSIALAKAARQPLRWFRPVEGSLAADSLVQAPRRTSATVAALMLSVSLVVGTAGSALSSFHAIQEWLDNNLNPDFFVSPSQTIADRSFRFSNGVGQELERVPGVGEVQPVRTARIRLRGQPVTLVGLELEKAARRIPRMAVAGDPRTMYRLAAEEKGLIISQNLAVLEKIGVGEILELNANSGLLRLPVVGIVRDFSNQLGSVYLDRTVYTRHYNDDTVDLFRVYLDPGASSTEVQERILETVGRGRRLFVLTNREVRDYVATITNQWFGMTYLQVFVAVLVAVLGIINTLTVSISDRRREFGLVRAMGGFRAQIRRAVWIEAAAIGVIGSVLGIAFGGIQLYYELQAIKMDLTGFPFPYEFPAGVAASLIPLILIVSFVAAILPGEAAVRASMAEALEYE
jgi:putative ABC transport system permease protein